MKISQPHTSSNRRAGFEGLSLALVALLLLSAAPRGAMSARSLVAQLATPLALFASIPELSASIVVNTSGDGDNVDPNAGCDADAATTGEQCTLRAAIQRANALAGDDIITVNIPTSEPNCNAGTGACSINLTKALPDLSDNLAINGPGMDKLDVRRATGGQYRIFNVTSSSMVTLSGMTISGGAVSGSGVFGGGVQNVNGTVNIVNTKLTSNTADTSAGGAGISNGGTLSLTNCTIVDNMISGDGLGGGIINSGTLTVTNSLISRNNALSGGGILNAGTATIINSTISSNRADKAGGGIDNLSAEAASVAGSVISDNTAGSGGGLANSSTGTVNITSTAIRGNTASDNSGNTNGFGGGIANNSAGTVSVTSSVISGNLVTSTTDFGAGIFNASGTLIVTSGVIYNNNGVGSTSGAGIRNETGRVTVTNSTIARNGESGGSLGISGSATVKSTIVAQNGSNVGLPNTDVSGNQTSQGYNLVGKRTDLSTYTQSTDQTEVLPEFDPNGVMILGESVPISLRCASPAIDKGTSAGLTGPLTTDVRGSGFPRTIDDSEITNAAGGDGTDIGALERTTCPQFTFTVNKTGDADDANPGDALCDSDTGAPGSQCTLRAAIRETNALTGSHVVNFAIPATQPDCVGATGACVVKLSSPLPAITTDLSISGPGVNRLTVRRDSGGPFSVFSAGGG